VLARNLSVRFLRKLSPLFWTSRIWLGHAFPKGRCGPWQVSQRNDSDNHWPGTYTHTHQHAHTCIASHTECFAGWKIWRASMNQILSLNPVLIDWYDPKKVSAQVYKMSCPSVIPCTIILLKHSIHMRNATFLPSSRATRHLDWTALRECVCVFTFVCLCMCVTMHPALYLKAGKSLLKSGEKTFPQIFWMCNCVVNWTFIYTQSICL